MEQTPLGSRRHEQNAGAVVSHHHIARSIDLRAPQSAISKPSISPNLPANGSDALFPWADDKITENIGQLTCTVDELKSKGEERMSDGHWETIRGSHRDSKGDPHSEPAAGTAGPESGGAGSGLRQSAEIVVGWRVWRLSPLPPASLQADRSAPLFLASTFMIDVWQPGEALKACCGANVLRHGIHAFTTRAQAVEYMSESRKPVRHVFGEVSLWGRVVIHERGYRAQYAYPKRIYVPQQYRGGRDIVNELRRSYGVEIDWTA